VVIIYTGEVPGYIVTGECISWPTVEGLAAGGDNLVRTLNSPMFSHGVGVCNVTP
jgi:hypothetical protein